jgi:hypothetical protein
MDDLLQATAKVLSQWLGKSLPGLSANWWADRVVDKLNETQRQRIDRGRISSLDSLDLAALLRVLDQNWSDLAQSDASLTRDLRTLLKELQAARNRWAHPPAGGISDDDAFRDADTVERLLKTLAPGEELLSKIAAFKAKCVSAMSTRASTFPRLLADAPSELQREQLSGPPSETEVKDSALSPLDAAVRAVVSVATEPGRRVTGVWQSKTGSRYRNVGMEAHIVGVEEASPRIVLTYVDERGAHQTVEDFGREGKVEQAVFEYLNDNKGRRAFFLLTKKPEDQKAKLASNTMMLPEYRHHWQT